VYDRYGPPDVLRIEDVERPAPKDDEVLVRVHAAAVTRADCATREANRRSGVAIALLSRSISGIRRPKQRILGSEFAGEVEAIGGGTNEFAVGDHVFGSSGFSFGAYAEFICMPESARIAHKPTGMSFEEAAAVCDGACTALSCLRRADLRKGQKILVYGATGSIGTKWSSPRSEAPPAATPFSTMPTRLTSRPRMIGRLDAPGAKLEPVMPGLEDKRSASVAPPCRRISSFGTTVTVAN